MMKKGIEYADKSWNPYSGCRAVNDRKKCAVGKRCWAYKMARRMKGRFGYSLINPFQPTFHPDTLNDPLKRKTPTRYDSCFMGDIAYCKKAYLKMILDVVRLSPRHIFYFLTKQPDMLAKKGLEFPDNAWLGVTVNRQDDVWRIDELLKIEATNDWVSFEPVYTDIEISLAGIDWVVIGAQSNPEIQPLKQWVKSIINLADNLDIPLFIKPNLKVVGSRMELPEAIRKVA